MEVKTGNGIGAITKEVVKGALGIVGVGILHNLIMGSGEKKENKEEKKSVDHKKGNDKSTTEGTGGVGAALWLASQASQEEDQKTENSSPEQQRKKENPTPQKQLTLIPGTAKQPKKNAISPHNLRRNILNPQQGNNGPISKL